MAANKWWGYVHENGSLHVKIFFGHEDIAEAWASPFVRKVYGPWEVSSREEALEALKESMTK